MWSRIFGPTRMVPRIQARRDDGAQLEQCRGPQCARAAPATCVDRGGPDVFRSARPVFLFVLREILASGRPRQCRRADRARAAAARTGPAAGITGITADAACRGEPGPNR